MATESRHQQRVVDKNAASEMKSNVRNCAKFFTLCLKCFTTACGIDFDYFVLLLFPIEIITTQEPARILSSDGLTKSKHFDLTRTMPLRQRNPGELSNRQNIAIKIADSMEEVIVLKYTTERSCSYYYCFINSWQNCNGNVTRMQSLLF